MPRLMHTDEHCFKLRAILLEDRVYDKPEHRNTMEGILYRMLLAVLGEIYQSSLACVMCWLPM